MSATSETLTTEAPPYPRRERVYLALAATFVVTLVLTNIIGVKLFQAPFNPSFALTTGILTYPATFLLTDIVSEVYGKRRADFMVVIGFFLSLFALGLIQLALAVPAHPYWVPPAGAFYPDLEGYQRAFASVFSLNGLLIAGSMGAYLVAQLTDNYLFHFWKRLTRGKHLWLRNNGSTFISQALDTLIVNAILFYLGFGMEWMVGLQIMLTIYLYKLALAALDTPLVYLGVYAVRRLAQEPAR
ncbi:MAG: queuosine precursor transporter [Deltaproteobacteria bacterium]|nr:queuosine precursor transporter [Deltaproteobacteria bacterium]